jgi:hypothetical protein
MTRMHATIIISACLATIALSGCESAPQWTSGNYEVYSMGGPTELEFGVDVGGGTQGLVNPQVAGVGEDALWIVVKQHPKDDKTKTNYFYLPKRSSDEQKKGLDVVQGPFSEKEFEQKSKDLKLPPFSRSF